MGRVRFLRVPARRLGALTRGASFDERKVSLGDHLGQGNGLCLSTLGIFPLPRCVPLAGRYIVTNFAITIYSANMMKRSFAR